MHSHQPVFSPDGKYRWDVEPWTSAPRTPVAEAAADEPATLDDFWGVSPKAAVDREALPQ